VRGFGESSRPGGCVGQQGGWRSPVQWIDSGRCLVDEKTRLQRHPRHLSLGPANERGARIVGLTTISRWQLRPIGCPRVLGPTWRGCGVRGDMGCLFCMRPAGQGAEMARDGRCRLITGRLLGQVQPDVEPPGGISHGLETDPAPTHRPGQTRSMAPGAADRHLRGLDKTGPYLSFPNRRPLTQGQR